MIVEATCVCGHASEEHGHDKQYPGSTACQMCGCIAYEPDESEDDDSAQKGA